MRQTHPRPRAPRRAPARRYLRLFSPIALVLFTAAVLAGCGTSGHKSSPTASATSNADSATAAVIVIKNFSYHPSSLTVSPGTLITVKNEDTATHTLTAVEPHKGAFNTGDIKPGTSTTFKAPSTPGSYPYICLIHQFMHGTLVVS